MEFIGEVFWQIVLLGLSGLVFSFVVWKLKGSKADFGDFLSNYGEMLAYASLFVIILAIIIIQSFK